jgi:uncharacterized repeat protein (TIGR03847 family)
MSYYNYDNIFPVTRITAGAVGEPGRRVFILQAQAGGETISVVLQKAHAALLSKHLPRLLAEVQAEYPELAEPLVAARPNLALNEPLTLAFRAGNIVLRYDRLHDLVVLSLTDADAAEEEMVEMDGPEPDLEIFTTRGQALLLSRQTEMVLAAGRSMCPNCGEPIDDFGHFCPPPVANHRWEELLQ